MKAPFISVVSHIAGKVYRSELLRSHLSDMVKEGGNTFFYYRRWRSMKCYIIVKNLVQTSNWPGLDILCLFSQMSSACVLGNLYLLWSLHGVQTRLRFGVVLKCAM